MDLIRQCADPQDASEILLRHALENFSHDNVTVLVVKLNIGHKDPATMAMPDGVQHG